jgi:hypothetical protein
MEIGYDPDHPHNPPLTVGADLTFLSRSTDKGNDPAEELLNKVGIQPNDKLLGMNLRYWDRTVPYQEWISAVGKGVRNFLENNPEYQLILLPFQKFKESIYTDDESVCQEAAKLIGYPQRVHHLRGITDPDVAKALIGRCRIFLGMRLHAVIFALQMGVPVGAVPYDPKVENQMGEAALGTVLPLTELGSGDNVFSLLAKLDREREPLSERALEFTSAQMDKARKQIPVLNHALEEKPKNQFLRLVFPIIQHKVKKLERLDQKLEQLQGDADQQNSEIEELVSNLHQRSQELQYFRSKRLYRLVAGLQKLI